MLDVDLFWCTPELGKSSNFIKPRPVTRPQEPQARGPLLLRDLARAGRAGAHAPHVLRPPSASHAAANAFGRTEERSEAAKTFLHI